MANNIEQCYDAGSLEQLLDDCLSVDNEIAMFNHLGDCRRCQTELERLSAQPRMVNEIQLHLASAKPASFQAEFHRQNVDCSLSVDSIKKMLAPTDNPEMLGRLRWYEVCGVIGLGSTGIVVKALDTRLNRFVAIKLLSPSFRNNGVARQRFEREARAVAAVTQENVIPIYSVDEYDGTPYFVMQYFPGGSLEQRIRKQGPLKTCEVVRIGLQIAKGLSAAHKQGVVHRDVKPANVLLENDVDRAMVSDFGLAQIVNEASMTFTGDISGTPQYMSPEQAKGESLDSRSDLFSLGSVMYAACVGYSPFRAETIFGVIKRVCELRPKPILEINPEIATWLPAFIGKLHSKCREGRFESADQVVDILSQELAHLQAPAMVAQPNRDWWDKSKPQSKLHRGFKRISWTVAILSAVFLMSIVWLKGLTQSETPTSTSIQTPSGAPNELGSSADGQGDGELVFQMAYDLHESGKVDAAIIAHQKAAQFDEYKALATYNLGCAWALKGEKDKAFEALNDALVYGIYDYYQAKNDKDLDSLRDDTRFETFLSRLRLQSKKAKH